MGAETDTDADTGQSTEDQDAVALDKKAVNDLISLAIGPRNRQLRGQIIKEVTALLSTQLEPVTTQLTGLVDAHAKRAEETSQTKEPPQNQPTARERELEGKHVALEKQIADLVRVNKEREEALIQERAKAAHDEEKRLLSKHLLDAGAVPHFVRFAVQDAHRHLIRGDDGKIMWRGEGEYDDPIGPAEGVAKFLDSDGGKVFLPPVQVDRNATTHGRSGRAGNSHGVGGVSDAALSAHIDSAGST